MQITISEENRIVLEELKEEAIQIKQEATELSISLLIQLKTLMFQFLLSYNEYSLTNIREHGLAEILMSRAMRFFKLDQGDEKPKRPKEKPKSKFSFKIKSRNGRERNKMNSQTYVNSKINIKKHPNNKTKKGGKLITKKTIKVILFPFYILILIFRIPLESKSKVKKNKNVKNSYNI
jgi:hypothetical protein